MAVDVETVTISESASPIQRFLGRISSQQKMALILAFSAIAALAVVGWIWGKAPDYKVLFSNVSSRWRSDRCTCSK